MVYSGNLCSQKNNYSPVPSLLNHNRDVAAIGWDGKNYFEPSETIFKQFPQCLVRNEIGLYIALNGTGRLYKAKESNGDIIFNRIDSTIYFGDNFDSFIFSYKDTLYSLGGYGNWKTKGILRYYVEQKHEWEVMRLNKEIPVRTGQSNDLLWYDLPNGKIYFGIINETNSTTTEIDQSYKYSLWELDLNTKKWDQLGLLNEYMIKILPALKNIISSPFGQFVTSNNHNIFLDYAHNRIYRLNETKQRELELLPTTSGDAHINYFIDSTFYTWLSKKNLVDSIKITKADLEPLKENIYDSLKPSYQKSTTFVNNKTWWIAGFIALFAFFILGYYIGKNKRKSTKLTANGYNGSKSLISFTALEKDVIRSISENSLNGLYTSIEDVNKALGVSKKNPEIQKKQRSDVITSINKKYSYITQKESELIEKKRTEFDKRSFEYFIQSSKLPDALRFTKENDVATDS